MFKNIFWALVRRKNLYLGLSIKKYVKCLCNLKNGLFFTLILNLCKYFIDVFLTFYVRNQ